MTSQTTKKKEKEGISFGFHCYDLARGIGQRFGESLVGVELPNGVLHAAVVIFGNEYFFEGGISKRPAGCTRFGKNFSYVESPVPATAVKSEEEFDAWLRFSEFFDFSTSSYLLVQNNCLTFTDVAAKFLTEGKTGAPDIISKNITPLLDKPVGFLLANLGEFASACEFLNSAEQMMDKREDQFAALECRMSMRKEEYKEKLPLTKLPCFTFSSSSSKVSVLVDKIKTMIKFAFDGRYFERMISPERLISLFTNFSRGEKSESKNTPPENIMTAVEASTLSTSIVEILQSPTHTSSFADFSDWLLIFAQLSLHDNFVLSLIHDQAARILLRRIAKHFFCSMPSSLKVTALELFCNLIRHPYASMVFCRENYYAAAMCLMICRGLFDYESWAVVHRASCLLLSFMYGASTLTFNGLSLLLSRRRGARSTHVTVRVLEVGMFIIDHVCPFVHFNQQQEKEVELLEGEEEEEQEENKEGKKEQKKEEEKVRFDCSTPEKSTELVLQELERRIKNRNKLLSSTKNTNPPELEIKFQDRIDDDENEEGENEDNEKEAEVEKKEVKKEKKEQQREEERQDSTTASFSSTPTSPFSSAPSDFNQTLEVSQMIIENVLNSMLLFATAGGEMCPSTLARSVHTPSMDFIKEKCSTRSNKNLCADLAVILEIHCN